MSKTRCCAVAVGALASMSAGQALAAGFYLQEQSTKGLGRAYSGEAADVGAESLWWNPAAIGEVQGVEVYAGGNLILSDTRLTDLGSTITRPGLPPLPVGGLSPALDPLHNGFVPNGDVAWRLNDHIALGLAISAPFDFTTKYSTVDFIRYQALTSKLFDIDVEPTIAWHVNRFLDLGAGFDAQYAMATLSQSLPNLSPLLPDGSNDLRGDGWNYGWAVGGQWHPTQQLSIGVSYRSRIDHQLGGTVDTMGLLGPLAGANGQLDGVARFATPWIVVFGGRYLVDDHWAIDVQGQRVGWSVFDAIRVETAAGLTVIPQNYHDTTTGAVGVDYTLNRSLTLRAGLAYDPTPTPNEGRSARVPDGNRWLFTVGATARPSPRFEVDAALAYVDLQNSRVSSSFIDYAGTPAATLISYNAEASGHAFILSSGVKFRF